MAALKVPNNDLLLGIVDKTRHRVHHMNMCQEGLLQMQGFCLLLVDASSLHICRGCSSNLLEKELDEVMDLACSVFLWVGNAKCKADYAALEGSRLGQAAAVIPIYL